MSIDIRSPTCPECGSGRQSGLKRSIDIDILDGGVALVISARCDCGWHDELELREADL